MIKNGEQKLWQAMIFLFCAVVALKHIDLIDGSEFAGGRITGSLFTMLNIGFFLFAAALLLTLLVPRVAAVIALVACVLILPLYLCFTAPGPFRMVFRGEYSDPLQSGFVWMKWPAIGLLSLSIAAYYCIRSLTAVRAE